MLVRSIQDAVEIPALVEAAEVGSGHVDAGDPVLRDHGDVGLAHERDLEDVYAVVCGVSR